VLDEEMDLLEHLHDTALSFGQRKAVLVQLLGSISPAGRGIAVDYYSNSSANLRIRHPKRANQVHCPGQEQITRAH
jgi:hypothetical protein